MFNMSKGFKIEQWKLNEHHQNKYKQFTCVVPKLRQAVGRLGQALVGINKLNQPYRRCKHFFNRLRQINRN